MTVELIACSKKQIIKLNKLYFETKVKFIIHLYRMY